MQVIDLPIEFKWPNDLLVGGKKLAGTLCETVVVNEQVAVIDGIGINVGVAKR